MSVVHARTLIERLLAPTGIQINGQQSWDIQVHDERIYNRVLSQGSLGLGEGYMDGWWDCEELTEMFTRIFGTKTQERLRTKEEIWALIKARLFNRQSSERSFDVGEQHYDISRDMYQAMLDKRMVYTCGYWKDALNLDEAQEAKLDLVCRKIGLKSGDHVLDIGGGWGSFAKFAAERYGASVVATTVSKEQVALGAELCRGLPVEIRFEDYRDTKGMYDHIVSIGMFEQVGYKNYRNFMQIVHDHLKENGLFLLHTIGSDYSVRTTDPWFDKYIFPHGMMPSIKQIGASIEKLFVMEDWHNFGKDYEKTLLVWFENFKNAWPLLKNRYDERFYRMWIFYLNSCIAQFRVRNLQLWQIVLSKHGLCDGYQAIR